MFNQGCGEKAMRLDPLGKLLLCAAQRGTHLLGRQPCLSQLWDGRLCELLSNSELRYAELPGWLE